MKKYQALCYILTWGALFCGVKTFKASADCPPPYLNSATCLTFDASYGYIGYGTSAHYLRRIQNPDRDPSNQQLRIGEDSPPIIHTYQRNKDNQVWILTKGGDLNQDLNQNTRNADHTEKTEFQEIFDPQTDDVARRIQRVDRAAT